MNYCLKDGLELNYRENGPKYIRICAKAEIKEKGAIMGIESRPPLR